MKQFLVHFDEATLKAIDSVAPAAKRKRAEFIRNAVKDALYKIECDRMRWVEVKRAIGAALGWRTHGPRLTPPSSGSRSGP